MDAVKRDADTAGSALGRLAAGLSGPSRRPPPVESWNPPHCGTIDIRIRPDGTWLYAGSAIGRAKLVKLFASVLRRDPDEYVLVTPVERLAIAVDDLPFAAVEMAVDGDGPERSVTFRTNTDDLVTVGPDNPLRFDEDAAGGLMPAVRVRGGLWARVTRALVFDLVELANERPGPDGPVLAIAAGGTAYPLPSGPAASLPAGSDLDPDPAAAR